MYFLLLFALFCNFFTAASHLENNNAEKTVIEDLTDGPVHEIMSHLDQQGKEHFSKVSKDIFKFDPREVVLNLPLENSKAPSDFVCHHLKIRKTLVINLKENNFDYDNQLFRPDSLTMKYLNCLTNIEKLQFGQLKGETRILADPHFKLQALFPKLRHLQFDLNVKIPLNSIPNDLKSLKIFYRPGLSDQVELKEKILQMKQLKNLAFHISDYATSSESPIPQAVAELKHLPGFKRLSIRYEGHSNVIYEILAQTNDIDYAFDFDGPSYIDTDTEDLMEKLPQTTETLKLVFYKANNVEKFRTALKSLKNLKSLVLRSLTYIEPYYPLLQSLPSSLTDLYFDGWLGTVDVNKIKLPQTLHSVFLAFVHINVFELLANHVTVLETSIIDPLNIFAIEKPFTRLRTLKLGDRYDAPSKFWIRFFDLLPMNMDEVVIKTTLGNENEFHIVEKKIISLEKRIKKFDFSAYIYSARKQLYGNYIFDGSQMIKND